MLGERRAGGLGEEEGRRLLTLTLSAFCPSVLEQNLGNASRAGLCYCHVASALCFSFQCGYLSVDWFGQDHSMESFRSEI